MRFFFFALLVVLIHNTAKAQYSALIVEVAQRQPYTRRVTPILRNGGRVDTATFTLQPPDAGGCGTTPQGQTMYLGHEGPMLSRDGLHLVSQSRGVLEERGPTSPPTAILRGPFDSPACLLSIAADSSTLLYFRVTQYDGGDGMGPTPQVDGVFEIYSFADRTTRVWTPDPQYGDIREFVLVDQTTLVVLEEIELRLTIAAVDLSSGSRTVFAQTDGSSMALGQLSYAAGTLVWMDETRGAQLVTRTTAPPNTGSGGWSLPAGAWAEYQWASLSPDGGFLGRIRQLPTAPAQPLESQLEITPRGSLLPQVVLRGAGSFHWESEESILAVVGSGNPRNPVQSLVRVGRGGGETTVVTSLASSRVSVVYPR